MNSQLRMFKIRVWTCTHTYTLTQARPERNSSNKWYWLFWTGLQQQRRSWQQQQQHSYSVRCVVSHREDSKITLKCFFSDWEKFWLRDMLLIWQTKSHPDVLFWCWLQQLWLFICFRWWCLIFEYRPSFGWFMWRTETFIHPCVPIHPQSVNPLHSSPHTNSNVTAAWQLIKTALAALQKS